MLHPPRSLGNELPTKISVVATVRNERSTVASFVQTLLHQALPPDEIIIVDGASTDGTRDILAEFESAGSIRLISQDCNIAQGRNLGIGHARNELVAITDAGCRVDPLWLQEIAKCFAGPGQPDVVSGNFAFDCHSAFEEAVVFSTFSPSRETSDTAQYYPSSRSVAFRKTAWKRAGGYPEWLYAAEDTLLNIRLRQLGYKFLFCKDALVYWRPRASWMTLAKQRFNFSRGNSRVGIGTPGYIINLQFHGLFFACLIGSFAWPPLALAAILVFGEHVRRHLWAQAQAAKEKSNSRSMFWRVLITMEFVRLVGIAGFLAGRWDRLTDPSFAKKQRDWMGIGSLDEFPPF